MEQKVAQIEQELAAEVAKLKARSTYDTLFKGIGARAPREPALLLQPTAAQLNLAMHETERAKAVWRASMDAENDAMPALEAALAKMELFEKATEGRVLSDKNFNKSFELEGRLKCGLAVLEAAEKRARAARATLQAAIALLQRLLDNLDERNRAGQVTIHSDAYADLWEDARICLTRTTDLVAQHDKELQKPVERSAGRSARAEERAKQR